MIRSVKYSSKLRLQTVSSLKQILPESFFMTCLCLLLHKQTSKKTWKDGKETEQTNEDLAP